MLIVFSGLLVGTSLGLIGGGGSILAIPLLIYLVGYDHPHAAIGTSALAVGVNAYLNLIMHRKKGHVNSRSGLAFTVPGLVGVLAGAQLGLDTSGKELLFLFAILMFVIAFLMFRRSYHEETRQIDPQKHGNHSWPKITLMGLAVGFGSGFFGIGGGFLIVPGLMYSAGLAIIEAVGTSLLSVGSFGLLTAARYSLSGDINLLVSAFFITGGIFGGLIGTSLSSRMNGKTLTRLFSVVIIAVAVYMLLVNWPAFLSIKG